MVIQFINSKEYLENLFSVIKSEGWPGVIINKLAITWISYHL